MKKRITLKEKVYSEMKASILNFDLKPGQRIYEEEIAARLGVSRTPIREALSTLLQEGLATSSPTKGYFVSDVSSKEIEELYQVREVLEILAIRSAMKKSTVKDWDRVEQVLKSLDPKNKSDKPTIKLFEDANQFHVEIVKICGNKILQQYLDMTADKIARIHAISMPFLDRAQASHREHLEILEHIKNGDTEKAIAANIEHLRISKEGYLHLIENKKNFFYVD